MGLGRYTDWLTPVRSYTNVLAIPFYWVTDIPERVSLWFDDTFSSRWEIEEENRKLREQVRVQQVQLQKMGVLQVENERLRKLMNSSSLVEDQVLIAELIGISPDPKTHKVMLDKGTNDGVYVGQAVLDASGLMGQIVATTPYSSEVLFLTDDSHAIPVQINRNNVRTVIEGIGDLYRLRLRYVPSTMDIIEGDLLVSSGLGGRFPAGYPVATVQTVIHDPGQPFATVYATPTAELNRSRHVLLVFHHDTETISDTALTELETHQKDEIVDPEDKSPEKSTAEGN